MALEPETNQIQGWLEAARRGEGEAFANLVAPHTPLLQRIAGRFMRNTQDAEDVCQEALLKAFTKLEQFNGAQVTAGEFRAWLTKITANCAIDFLRRREGGRALPIEDCEPAHSKSYEAGASGWGDNPESLCVRQERARAVADAITTLPNELRTICLLRNMMELSTKEAAARLGISALAVRLRLFRAHGQLRKNMNRSGSERTFRSAPPSLSGRRAAHRFAELAA